MSGELFLDDSYMRECESVVLSVEGREVVLDRTVFYPRGGGQPGDTGRLKTESGLEFRVLNVVKKEGGIVHELDHDGLKAQDQVHCVLDWDRRYKLMRMHTAAHVLAALMHSELGVLISGNQLGEERTRFDFNMREFDRASFERIVEKANEALGKGTELGIRILPREEAMKIPGVIKLAGALPPSLEYLRIVEIPGIDVQADGGTHVKSLNEVGKIRILQLENKGSGNRRIYFTLSE